MKKKYAVYGIVEWYANINGCHCHFKNGAINAFAITPATYATADEKEQRIIESSKEFKSGKIKIDKVYGTPAKAETTISSDSYPEVTNIQTARVVLGSMGVSIENMQTKAEVLKIAKEKNITFPNWK